MKSDEIIFTSGGTESNNLAIKGAVLAYQSRGKHLITSQIEHSSVTEVFKELETAGFRVSYLPVDESGAVRVTDLQAALCDDTILVSIMHVNNEMGRIQPIAEIGNLLAAYPKVIFHVDAIQSIGKLPFKPKEYRIDLCSASAHKFRGPKGAGFLYKREGVQLQSQLVGGGQENGLRSGTENVPLLVGMAKALRMSTEQLEAQMERKYQFRQWLADGIASIPQLMISGTLDREGMAPHIIHFTFPGTKAEVVVHALEQENIYISTRSACASSDDKPSDVLVAMGYDHRRAISGLRVSFSEVYGEAEAQLFMEKLKHVVDRLVITMKTPNHKKGGRR
ncbi:Cysteine desulfurase [compost metagenome]